MSILNVEALASTVVGSPTRADARIFDMHVGTAKSDNEVDLAAHEWAKDYAEAHGRKPRLIGVGTHAAVHEHPTDKSKVIKVVHKPDPCWRFYAELINRLPRDERVHVPRMRASALNPDGTSVHIMERLLPASKGAVSKSFKLDPYPWTWFQYLNDTSQFFLYTSIKTARHIIRDIEKLTDDDGLLDAVEQSPHPFNRLMAKLRAECRLDIHDDNIMFRPNGELVLSDPVENRP